MVCCTGCQRHFLPSGYTLHVQRTKNASCKAAYEHHIENIRMDKDSSEMSFDNEVGDVDEAMNDVDHEMAGM